MHNSGFSIVFDWEEYLNLAKDLVARNIAQSQEDAILRSAISRAYYAAFHKAKALAPSSHFISRGFSSHREVIDFLQRSQNVVERQLGVDLDRLRRNRVKADYEDQINGLLSLTQFSLNLAQTLISHIP